MSENIIIVNLHASRASDNIDELKKLLNQSEFEDFTLIAIQDPEKIAAELEKIVQAKPKTIILAGGDGTIITSIEQSLNLGFTGNFGILPLGTSNYLARGLNIPLEAPRALSSILQAEERSVYLGGVNNRLFSLFVAVGITSAASKHVKNSHKKRFGQLAYIAESLKQLHSHKNFTYDITTNDGHFTGTSHQLLIANADINQQITIAPDANIHAKQLRLTIYKSGSSKMALLGSVLLYMLSFGHIKRNMLSLLVNNAQITVSPQQPVSVDGESITQSTINIQAAKQQIRILT